MREFQQSPDTDNIMGSPGERVGAAGWRKRVLLALEGPVAALGRALVSERRCVACASAFTLRERGGEDEAGARLFCADCAEAMPRLERGFCPVCGEIAAWPHLPPAPCARCLVEPPPWRGFACHGPHEGLLRRLLIRLKFRDQIPLAHALGLLLAGHPGLKMLAADVVVPVPLHTGRLADRGYNQALELARPVARLLGLPLRPRLIRRIRATPPQVGSSREARKKNIVNAFAAERGARGGHVLLVDDTLTTGATLIAASDALLEAGASAVSVAVVSRTLRHCKRFAD